jgi:3-hydroxyisobutyrate dehydrogenase
MYEVISGASGDSSVLQQRFPASGVLAHTPASNDWAALFPVDLMIKDVLLALDAAAHGLTFPVTTAAEERYRAAHDAGWGELDYSTIARLRFD